MIEHVTQIDRIDIPVPCLTDAQGKQLAYLFAKSGRFDGRPGDNQINDKLIEKRVVEKGDDDRYGVSLLGLSALAVHFAHMARKRGGSTAGLIRDRVAA